MTHAQVLDEHILNIVQCQEIAEQVDLQQALHARGYEVPQATLSRRLKKLKIAKIAGIYRVVDWSVTNLPLVLHAQVSEFGGVVLHTHPGHASSLASYLDKKYLAIYAPQVKPSGIIGTLAGDDTILLIAKSAQDLPTVIQHLKDEFPYLSIN